MMTATCARQPVEVDLPRQRLFGRPGRHDGEDVLERHGCRPNQTSDDTGCTGGEQGAPRLTGPAEAGRHRDQSPATGIKSASPSGRECRGWVLVERVDREPEIERGDDDANGPSDVPRRLGVEENPHQRSDDNDRRDGDDGYTQRAGEVERHVRLLANICVSASVQARLDKAEDERCQRATR